MHHLAKMFNDKIRNEGFLAPLVVLMSERNLQIGKIEASCLKYEKYKPQNLNDSEMVSSIRNLGYVRDHSRTQTFDKRIASRSFVKKAIL